MDDDLPISKPNPSPEMSLKYISWSVKRMDESLQKMAKMIEEYIDLAKAGNERLQKKVKAIQEELPF